MESEKKKKLEQAGWKIGSANEFLDDLTELKSWGLAVPFIETVKERAANDAEFKNELLNELLSESEKKNDVLCQITKLCNEKIKMQKERENGCGYGNDDYSDGRTVGAASLARNIMRKIRNL